VAVRIVSIVDNKEAAYNHGTGVLVRVGDRHIVITAWHVLAGLLKLKEHGQECYLMVGNSVVEPPILLLSDELHDVAVIAVSSMGLDGVDACPYVPLKRWPPRRVTTGDAVLVCGLPRYLRSESESSEIDFGDISIVHRVTSASEHQFVLHLAHDDLISLGRDGLPPTNASLGGISGAPIFLANPESFELVGIVKEIADTLPLLYAGSLHSLPAVF
jgi:Trypsin-like peptidase domain